uniref:Condensin complex subunit 1 C-terminal domain-containing protein n=1 Tax=Kalanchoe fedtschenkoi TaxID=63787 RepID=A0A7N0UIQ3_KALFE
MEETLIPRIISDLGALRVSNPQTPISESTLSDLETLIRNTNSGNDLENEVVENLFDELSSRKVSPSVLVDAIARAMDLAQTNSRLSILACKVYLSLILCENAPVFTLFTPMAFHSLLHSVRRFLKNPKGVSGEGSSGGSRKRKGGKGRARKSPDEVVQSAFDVKELFSVLKSLERVLGLVHLDRFSDCLKSLIQTVAEMPVLAVELCLNTATYDRLTELCSKILCEVLKAEHGDQSNSAAEVLKSLSLPILLHKSPARTFSLGFVRNTMMNLAREAESVKKAVVNFPRYLMQRAPERSEPRAMAVDSVMEIVQAMELTDQLAFVEYVLKMSQGKMSTLRVLAVDLMSSLMASIKDPLGVEEDEVPSSWGAKCLEALFERCSDVSVGIRARALSNLANIAGVLSSCGRTRDALKELIGLGCSRHERIEGRLSDLLRMRCMDEKAAVRKASLLLISKLTTLQGGAFDEALLKTMGMACSDPLVSIRKAAVSALSEAFRASTDRSVTMEWLHSVPRLIADNESSIQEECENLFLELVLDRISRAASDNHSPDLLLQKESTIKGKYLEGEMEKLFPGGVLSLLKDICNSGVMPWVKKICTSLGKKKRLKPRIATAVWNIIKTSEFVWLSHSMPIEKWTAPAGAWFLLAEVSAFVPKAVDWEFLHHHWQLIDKIVVKSKIAFVRGEDSYEAEMGLETNSVAWAGDRVFLLQTISSVSVELTPEAAAELAHNLLKKIEEFSMHPTEINAHVKALRTLCKRKALNPDEADALVVKWVLNLLAKASKIIEKYISGGTESINNGSLTPATYVSIDKKKAKALPMAINAVYTVGCLVIVCPTVDLSAIVPVLYSIITSGKSNPKLNKLPGPRIPLKQTSPSLYIQAWLAMGKICLADVQYAKTYIPLFVQELENSDNASLRNNLVATMADFCVRHTALVDCYISRITKCLQDPCELVRRQTFILLSRLLQRDYVKWRGVLFLRFLLSLVDDSEKIRHLADFLFGNILKVKAPLLAYNSFVEAVYVLNDCHMHSGHNDKKSSKSDSRLSSIKGNDEKARSKRMHIYTSLLKQMAPEHLLATFAKVCAEILASASDGMLNINDVSGQSVLQDAFQILSCKEIRITSIRGSSSDAAEMDEEIVDGTAASKGRSITQAIKKGLIQNTVPIFIELKRLLESNNSPLTGSLMECLRVLLKDYKNEIDEILVADKQLQKELIYDMQKYEAAKARSAAAAATQGQTSNPFRSPPAASNRKLGMSNAKVASAVADVVAAARARSVLKEVNRGVGTPPVNSMSLPRLKSASHSRMETDRRADVIASLRRRQNFDEV